MLLRYLLWSAGLGPPVGILTLAAAALAERVLPGYVPPIGAVPGPQDMPEVAIFAVMLTYVAGILPSLAAGLANGLLASRVSGRLARTAPAIAVGAAIGILTLLVFRSGEPPPVHEALIWMLAGGAGSLVPALIASRGTP